MLDEQFAAILSLIIEGHGHNDHIYNLKTNVTNNSTVDNITRGLIFHRGLLLVNTRFVGYKPWKL